MALFSCQLSLSVLVLWFQVSRCTRCFFVSHVRAWRFAASILSLCGCTRSSICRKLRPHSRNTHLSPWDSQTFHVSCRFVLKWKDVSRVSRRRILALMQATWIFLLFSGALFVCIATFLVQYSLQDPNILCPLIQVLRMPVVNLLLDKVYSHELSRRWLFH
jgi:hypothetical protein